MNIGEIAQSDVDRLIRYAYSGFLLVGILLFTMPRRIQPILEAGGSVVTPLTILAAGAVVYVLYRYVLNDLILSLLILHPLHGFIDRFWRRSVPTNPANFLTKVYKVPRWLGHQAYAEVRRGFYSEEQRKSFNRNHTEATIVWLTAIECTFAGGILNRVALPEVSPWKGWLLLGVGLLTIVAAVVTDIHLFQQECRALRANEVRLSTFLRECGLLAVCKERGSDQQRSSMV